jgi:hypothetical protein
VKPTFKPGDIVQHTKAFLQSVAWYTNVPIDGKVLDVDDDMATVQWCDQDVRFDAPTRINTANLKLKTAWEPN